MKKIVFFLCILCSRLYAFSQQDAWVYLDDKLNVASSISNPISILTQKAIDRKSKHNVSIDERDVPVNETYITQIKNATGITVMAKSKWFNALHVRGIQTDIEALENFSFVSHIDFADNSLNANKISKEKKTSKLEAVKATFAYGNALNQIEMFHGDDLHLQDYTGTGVTIAVIDAGFPNVNSMTAFQRLRDAGNLIDGYDFVNRDHDVYVNTTSNHGTLVLSTMAGYIENSYVGTAPDASYYLFITEDATSENPVEESYWVEAAERADSLGVDLINTSLGYRTYDNANYSYTISNMDGNTAYITRGANIAFEKGLLLVNSAGNSGGSPWGIVGAPADAMGVFSIGAVDANGDYALFSSIGNATQPTQKPDVVAQGLSSYVITENDVIATASGTSFSSPIIAGGIACLMQALPNKTNAEIMQLVRESASQYMAPDYELGFGIPNLEAALNTITLTTNNYNLVDDIELFPNPTSGTLYVKNIPKEITKITFFNSIGQEVFNTFVTDDNNKINLASLATGLYIINVKSNSFTKTFKLVKE